MSDRTPNPDLLGAWRITWTEVWATKALDLLGPASIVFTDDGLGEFRRIAVHGWLDCRYGERDGRPLVEFSWEGRDDADEARGRGWAALDPDGSLRGHLYFHLGEESAFTATRAGVPLKPGRSAGRPPRAPRR